MTRYSLVVKPATNSSFGRHDPGAVLFDREELLYGVEEERFTRNKHAVDSFPTNAIQACLDHRDLELPDVDRIVLPYRRELELNIWRGIVSRDISNGTVLERGYRLGRDVKQLGVDRFFPVRQFERRLEAEFGTPIPPIERFAHHACHAASAFHPSGFDRAIVLTIDGRGEYDSTVVWRGDRTGLTRLRTYEFPNSLGYFYAAVTEFLGFRAFNGEGKVMGLAPYGDDNPAIEQRLRQIIDTGVDYDVRKLTHDGHTTRAAERLEKLFGRSMKDRPEEFTQWEKDLAYTAQKLLEEIVVDIVEASCRREGIENVALAGGVALNCKMNKRVMESAAVADVFIQPVAHDAGLAVGGGMVDKRPGDVPDMSTTYWGPAYSTEEIEALLQTNKLDYERPDDLARTVAERIADGALVGWFQGRLEMGPRALGNRSILADPRSTESRDRVNRYVKHREEWRPFAPSMLESAVDEYLVDPEPAPYMIKTFDVRDDSRDEIAAVLHPGDETTRPQTVREEQNPRYHRLISEFEAITDVPVLLNTSFNDHGEPIVTRPREALKDFYGMGLDLLVLEDLLIEK
ncbi:carbamoyltransferase family protein [Natrinema amylolyticum]|uniref:carbamoyltransferase family protein n=1 Tax=Natrinema amylolyticum TaxID=2878679 RepID=UPI001CFBCBAA|nr:carbamoyltransferase C-terminal domain-containing protein [Natrinema amylolyticum]